MYPATRLCSSFRTIDPMYSSHVIKTPFLKPGPSFFCFRIQSHKYYNLIVNHARALQTKKKVGIFDCSHFHKFSLNGGTSTGDHWHPRLLAFFPQMVVFLFILNMSYQIVILEVFYHCLVIWEKHLKTMSLLKSLRKVRYAVDRDMTLRLFYL